MRNIYIAAQSQENGINHAHVIKVSEEDNLLNHLKAYKNLVKLKVFSSKWRAEDKVSEWNENFKQNGTFGFIAL